MLYTRSTLNDIDDLQDASKLFSILIQPTYRGDHPYWTDIWNGFKYFTKNKDQSLFDNVFGSMYFHDNQKLKALENFGLDYNHRDAGGNNFFQYVMGLSRSNKDEPQFRSKALEYIIDKTEDIYKPNHFNRNVLFDMLSYSIAGMDGKDFFAFIQKYPDFDIHLVDKAGKNLIFQALLINGPFPIIDYFIKNGVSLTQVDNDNHNLLHMFLSFGQNENNIKLFDMIFESVESIAHKSKYGDSAIEFFISCSTDIEIHKETRDQYNFWTKHSLNKIIKGEFKTNEKNITDMIAILEDKKSQYQSSSSKEDALLYERALKALNYFLLDMKIENTNNQTVKKIKI